MHAILAQMGVGLVLVLLFVLYVELVLVFQMGYVYAQTIPMRTITFAMDATTVVKHAFLVNIIVV